MFWGAEIKFVSNQIKKVGSCSFTVSSFSAIADSIFVYKVNFGEIVEEKS